MASIAKKILVGTALFIVILGFVGCATEEDNEEEIAQTPELPPTASMTMDFSAFGGSKMAPELLAPGKNFTNAAARVLFLDVAVILALTPPATFFKSASNAMPIDQGDGSWLWSSDLIFLGKEYQANLTGITKIFGASWSMKVTSDQYKVPLDNFEWYKGENTMANTSGNWQFFDPDVPEEAKQIATIEWTVESVDKGKIFYTNTDDRSPNFDDKLTYSVDGTTASIMFHDASENIISEITWDLVTTAGSIKVPNYNNGERAYWDENKQDVVP